MADRQGRALWPGVQGFISCTYTASHGISPGVAALTIPEQDVSGISAYGTLVITDGIGTIQIPRCKVIDVQFSGGGGSPRTITLLIADRRWMWKFGGISGNWNQTDPYPDPDSFPPSEFVSPGEPYMPGTYRTADKLIADCLAALNETRAVIDPLPVIPVTMSWDNEPPAEAMQAVCDVIGYRIVYQPMIDRVIVVPKGEGFPLPNLPTIISGSNGIDPPERPNAFQLVGGDTIWNDYLELEPVAVEANGKVVKLDDASFKPSVGWGREDPLQFGKVFTEFGALAVEQAKRYVWRTFRVKMRDVKTQAEGYIEIPRYGKVTDRKQVVLNSQAYGLTKDERGQQRTESASVYGSVFMSSAGAPGQTLNAFGNTTLSSTSLPLRPQIDSARGLVTFDQPVFKKRESGGTTGYYQAPELYLYTSFRLRSLAGMIFDQFKAAGASPVAADPLCPPAFVRHPELVAIINVQRLITSGFFMATAVSDNLDELKAAADYYLTAADRTYQLNVTSERTYAGIVPLSPDGAIEQVTWSVGGGPATTQASRGTEHSAFVPPYPERRRREQASKFARKQAKQEQSPGSALTSPGMLNEILKFNFMGAYGTK